MALALARPDRAALAAARALSLDPAHEPAARALMRAQHALGRGAAAGRVHAALSAALADLGLKPCRRRRRCGRRCPARGPDANSVGRNRHVTPAAYTPRMTQDTHKQGMEGRAALVTGGTSGIGLAIAQRLAQDGLRVAVLDLDRPQAREVAQAHGLTFVGADLSRRADCRRAVDETVAALDGLDVLVNNAGFQHIDPIAEFPEDTWDAMLHVMLTAPFLLSRYAWPHLTRSGQGRIVNVASIHGHVASPSRVRTSARSTA